MSRGTNASGVLSALRSFVTAAPQVPAGAAGTFSYDLTDLHRQFLVDLFSDAHGALGGRYIAAASAFPPGNASVSVDALIELCRSIMTTLDAALAADPNFLLGTWIDDSASWGQSDSDPEATARWVFNARTQLTMWGPVVGELDDYAAKHWAGLVEGYYAPRWGVLFDGTQTFAGSSARIIVSSSLLLAAMSGSARSGQLLNLTAVAAATATWEEAWGRNTSDRPPSYPSGADPAALAAASLAKFASWDPSKWLAIPDTDVWLPSPPRNFTQVRKRAELNSGALA